MSYILDALKKSEKERHWVKERDDRSVHEAAPDKKKRPLWPYFLGVLLLLNGSVLLLWFAPWHTKQSTLVHDSKGRQANIAGVGDVPSDFPERRTEKKQNNPVDLSKPLPDMTPSKEKRTRQARGVREGASPEIKQVSASDDTRYEPARESEIPPPDKNRLYTLNDLPLPVKQHLPEFSVSVFLYSDDPASRMVRINGQLLKEGQYLTEGVKLEEIVPDGVIFSCRAYRFHVRLK